MSLRTTGLAIIGSAAAWLALGMGQVAPPAAAQGFVGLPPPPGSIGPVRRGADGRIEPAAPPPSPTARRRAAGRAAAPGAVPVAEPAEEPASDVPWTATQQPSRSIQPQFLEVEPSN
ncbi:MAG: hypothetical protein JNL66_03110 [Alphaproteobacteria bacterium]|nr:hypothetical protein [Alphaproteobacteria bacterium]